MDRVVDLSEVVQREVTDYLRGGDFKAQSFYLETPEGNTYAIITVPDSDHPFVNKPVLVMMVRVVNGLVFIDADMTDRPLYKELLRCGIPREQIILAYAGETSPAEMNEQGG
jgi:hypothetical protein